MARSHWGQWLFSVDDIPGLAGKLLDLVFLSWIGFIESVLMSDLTFIESELGRTAKLIDIGLASMNLSQDQATTLRLIMAVANFHQLGLRQPPAV
jgi:hypothetical protein